METPPDPASSAATKASLQPYSVGAPTAFGTRRLHLNEFRFTHAPGVIQALHGTILTLETTDLVTNYPTGADPALLDSLAAYVGSGAARENVLVAAGSDEVLRAVIDTCGLRGHRQLLMGVPGYTHFEHYARLRELEVVPYSIVGPAIRITPEEHEAALLYHEPLLAAGCLVYLCSPNNPTGDVWAREQVDRLAAAWPASFFLVDEAYIEFVSVDTVGAGELSAARMLNHASVVAVALARRNVVVARTLSKAFGLAALRVGYAVAHADTIAALAVAVSPKAVGPLASRVARAVFGFTAEEEGSGLFEGAALAYYRSTTRAARDKARLAIAALTALGWRCVDGRGNFYLVHVGNLVAAAVARLAEAGVQVRDRDDLPGLQGFVRVTAGTGADTMATIRAFGVLAPPAFAPTQAFYTPKDRVTALKWLARAVVGVLRAASLEFWAQGGTLLGLARQSQGFVPWDDDVDLAYRVGADGRDPLVCGDAGLKTAFAAKGLALQRNRTNAYWQVGANRLGEPISAVHIDIFSYYLDSTTAPPRYLLHDERFRHEEGPASPGAHCNTTYAPEELFPLHEVACYDFRLHVPHKTETVLGRALGRDYLAVARIRTGPGTHEERWAGNRSLA